MVRSVPGPFQARISFGWEGVSWARTSLAQAAAVPGTKHLARGLWPAGRVGVSSLLWAAFLDLMRSHSMGGASPFLELQDRPLGANSHFGWAVSPQAPQETRGPGEGGGLTEPAQEWPAWLPNAFIPSHSTPHLLGKQPPLTTCPLAPPAEDTPRSNC